jgi:hypothetical protein
MTVEVFRGVWKIIGDVLLFGVDMGVPYKLVSADVGVLKGLA